MTQSSELKAALKRLREISEREKGKTVDTSWTDDLPDDPLPTEEGETSVTFVKKSKSD